ncbi:YbhB/YbcL family Raf kinase inhibitor-like protein [Thiolapillus sp.]
MQRSTSIVLSSLLIFCAQSGMALELSSPDISDQTRMAKQQEYQGFGCDGENISPALSWKDVPPETKSFALTVYDPDAPTGSGWWHWVVFNIPADTRALPKDAGNPARKLLPAQVVQSRTDFGTPGYGGPCPPKGHGTHHYHFTLYALDVEKLPHGEDAPAAQIGFFINQHKLAESTITGLYSR